MFKKILLIGAPLLGVLLIGVWIVLAMSPKHEKAKPILREAKTPNSHIVKILDGEYVKIQNLTTGAEIITKSLGVEKSTLKLPPVERIPGHSPYPDSPVVDPESLDIKRDILPYTYKGGIDSFSMYIQALRKDGWKEEARFSDSLTIDMYFSKEEFMCRVIITNTSMKVFSDITEILTDSETYINGSF